MPPENVKIINDLVIPEKVQDKLQNLPVSPGIYHFKDAAGKPLYIGKAKILRSRVRSYFQSKPVSSRLEAMIKKITDIEIITTDTEVEALILELNLINELKPRYNVNFKDDKSYPYIVITNEQFPRVFPTRKKRNDGSKYFGPYTDVKNMRFALKTVRDIFMLRSCNLALTEETIAKHKFKVCLDYHIKKCEGPCEALISREEYNSTIRQVSKLLNGKTDSLINDLNVQMEKAAATMDFERAARLRDKLNAVEVYSAKQKMVDEDRTDKDIAAIAKEDKNACGMVLKIREGKVIGKTHYYIDNVLEKEEPEILETFLTSYYSKTDFIPEYIHIEYEIESRDTLNNWLTEKCGSPVHIVVPKIGEKARFIGMVKKNAKLMLDELLLSKSKRDFVPHSIEALKRDLRLSKLPRIIECFDISHIQGTDTVASMVTFQDGKPKKSEYRKFKLKNVLNEVGQPDDFLSMREVIYRRFKKTAEDKITKTEEDAEDKSNLSMPDLIVIDGGKGQLSSAVKVLEDLGMIELNIIGLAKRLEEVYLPGNPEAQSIPHTSSGLKLLQRIRDEAHRFAVTYHRTLRNKRTFKSELNDIPGIGEKTAAKLLTKYGSVEKLKEKLLSEPAEFEKESGKATSQKLTSYFNGKGELNEI